jgi:hypothetical protein
MATAGAWRPTASGSATPPPARPSAGASSSTRSTMSSPPLPPRKPSTSPPHATWWSSWCAASTPPCLPTAKPAGTPAGDGAGTAAPAAACTAALVAGQVHTTAPQASCGGPDGGGCTLCVGPLAAALALRTGPQRCKYTTHVTCHHPQWHGRLAHVRAMHTRSGKTYTMRGTPSEPGIVSLAVHDVFDLIEEAQEREFLLRVSYMEVRTSSSWGREVEGGGRGGAKEGFLGAGSDWTGRGSRGAAWGRLIEGERVERNGAPAPAGQGGKQWAEAACSRQRGCCAGREGWWALHTMGANVRLVGRWSVRVAWECHAHTPDAG